MRSEKNISLILIAIIIALSSLLIFQPKLSSQFEESQNIVNANYITAPQEETPLWLKTVVAKAKDDKTTVTFVGSSHSQGGHSYAQNGIVIDLSNLDKIERINDEIIRVQAGATWKKVIEYLNPLGLSVSIMQSDYDFSIGGTISTNVHGWQAGSKPIISSVEGLHLLTADGNLLYCSREENYDLFKAVIGGYGLLGVIIDVDLKTAPNRLYSSKQLVIKSSGFVSSFTNEVENNPRAKLFFARFSLHKESFLEEIIIRTYEEYNDSFNSDALKTFKYGEKIINYLFALTADNSFFKKMRWKVETSSWVAKKFKVLSRNQLLYHSTKLYTAYNSDKVDLLQEYFVPLEHFNTFTSFLKSMENELSPYLMNLTLRHVKKDDESILNYAKSDMICFVMFFRGTKTGEFENKLKQAAVKITDKVLALNGSYYLPYKPFQTREQFQRSYPKFQQFKQLKELFDPNKIFQNNFYDNYLSDI